MRRGSVALAAALLSSISGTSNADCINYVGWTDRCEFFHSNFHARIDRSILCVGTRVDPAPCGLSEGGARVQSYIDLMFYLQSLMIISAHAYMC